MTIAIRIPHYHITHRKWGVWAATLPWVCLVTLTLTLQGRVDLRPYPTLLDPTCQNVTCPQKASDRSRTPGNLIQHVKMSS